MNDFKLELGRIRHGWVSIGLFNKEELLIGMSGTGVYNPFYEFPKIFKSIMNESTYKWRVDQEGFDGLVEFLPNGQTLTVKTQDLRNNPKYNPTQTTFDKSQVLDALYKEIVRWEKVNREEMSDIFYDFWFNIREVVSLYEKGHYDHEIIEDVIYRYKGEVILSKYDTKRGEMSFTLNDVKEVCSLQSLLRDTVLYGELLEVEDMENTEKKSIRFNELMKGKEVEVLKRYCRDELFHAYF